MADFKVGDRVRIRSYESMEKEFKHDEGGIRCRASFTKLMKPLCGRLAKILSIDGEFVNLDFEDKSGDTNWQYSVDMIEKTEYVLPRICYILGGEDTPLEIGEEFEVKGYCPSKLHVAATGMVIIKDRDYDIGRISSDALQEAINHPEKIIRKPSLDFSDDEKALMRLYVGAGYPWLAKDKDGRCFAYSNKPYKRTDDYSDGTGDYNNFPDSFFPQITWESSPFNAAEYLEGLKYD